MFADYKLRLVSLVFRQDLVEARLWGNSDRYFKGTVKVSNGSTNEAIFEAIVSALGLEHYFLQGIYCDQEITGSVSVQILHQGKLRAGLASLGGDQNLAVAKAVIQSLLALGASKEVGVGG